ncbi:hypothetical protein M9Y10_028194 [Tritrichomonas musculus]|uniref:IQ calmodulin-binding motif family protein n=1 Tax=Tritrichomonas musculus TaxID=1915356 RepID=A0ABR2KIR6_9EUKA
MKRFMYSIKHTQNISVDPENPDTRPINLARIVKPKVNSSTAILKSNNQYTKKSITQKNLKALKSPDEDEFPDYTPPHTPGELNPQSKKIQNFLNAADTIDKEEMPSQKSNSSSRYFNQNSTYGGVQVIDLESRPQASKEESKILAADFVRNFILEKTQDVQALVIQNAFRLYLKKVHWKRCIGIHIQYHMRLKRLTFLCWRLVNTNDPVKLEKLFSKFSEFYEFIKNRFKVREIVPFRLFYISGRLFLPEGYTATVVYSFIYLMSMPLLHRIIRLWAYTTRKRRNHWKTLQFIRFTSKKLTCYGQIYHFFQMWHRYVKWKKLEKNAKKSDKFLSINAKEVNPRWNVLERKMNTKRIHILRANEHSQRRICAKAIRALYNRSIETIAEAQIIETSDNFRNLHLQMLAHRAWLKFLQKKSQETQTLRDCFRSWYTLIYEHAERDFLFDLSTMKHDNMKLIKIMNSWYLISKERKIKAMGMMLKTQANPSLCLAIIFMLKNEFELFYSTLTFRLWIRFIRSRNRWKNFARWSDHVDPDRETKQIILTELRRVANLRLLRRIYVSAGAFFPRHVGFSFELTKREYVAGRVLDAKLAHAHIYAQKEWAFLTEGKKKQEPPIYTWETLVRCFLLRLNSLKKFDSKENGSNKQSQANASNANSNFTSTSNLNLDLNADGSGVEKNPYFEKFRSFDELTDAIQKNTSLLRGRLTVKMSRDKAVLAGMVSHISASKVSQSIDGFTTMGTFTFVKSPVHDMSNMKDKVIVFPDLNESIACLLRELRDAPPKIPYNFEEKRDELVEAFHQRLRDPQTLTKKTGRFGSAMSLLMTSMMQLAAGPTPDPTALQPNKNPLISSYQSTSSQKSLTLMPENGPDLTLDLTSINTGSGVDTDSKTDLFEQLLASSRSVHTPGLMSSRGRNLSSRTFSIGGEEREDERKFFTIDYFKNTLEQTGSYDQMISSVCRFIIDTSGVMLDCQAKTDLNSNSEEIQPDADPSMLHKMTRNIAHFLAQMAGIKDLSKVPRKVNAPSYAQEAVIAVLAIHKALMKTSLSQYCDQVPFSKPVVVGDDLFAYTLNKVWNDSKKKYTKIEIPIGLKSIKQFSSLSKSSRFGSVTFGSMVMSLGTFSMSSTASLIDEPITSRDVFTSCFLLPYIMSFDSITDFSKDEIVSKISK